MIKPILTLCLAFSLYYLHAQSNGASPVIESTTGKANFDNVHPLDLEFHRLAVRRFIFSNNIKLTEFVPSQIVSFESMHPAFLPSSKGIDEAECDTCFMPFIEKGKLVLDARCRKSGSDEQACRDVSFYVGAVNPFATYEIDINHIERLGVDQQEADSVEVGF